MSTDSDTTFTRYFVYEGLVDLTGGKPGVALHECTEDGTLTDNIRYFKAVKELKHRSIGSVYAFDANASGIYLTSARFVRQHSDRAYVTQLRINDDIRETKARIAKLEKAAKADDMISEALASVREAYAKTDQLGKRAIEAMILNSLRKGF